MKEGEVALFKRILFLSALLICSRCLAEEAEIWALVTGDGQVLTQISTEPTVGDEYISGDNLVYQIIKTDNGVAHVEETGSIELPSIEWMDAADEAASVLAVSQRIARYCTHSDESYEPSDGFYSTTERGTIYQVAHELADSLNSEGIETTVSDQLHHPHDAGAYRRSRQTAIQLIKTVMPDCLIDIHRDGIPDPASYAVMIGGREVSKIRLLVGRGNQNAAVNKEFALMIKAVADRVYPGLIKDIYLGKGAFNQDLLPHSILLECGTYTLEKERVLASMPMMADVLDRALYGGVTGSVGRVTSDVSISPKETAGITYGVPDVPAVQDDTGTGSGLGFLGMILGIGIVGVAILSAGSWKGGARKSARNLSEMTGGLIGKKPQEGEDHQHS